MKTKIMKIISGVPLSMTCLLESYYAPFCQLGLSKSSLLQIQKCQNHVFSAANIISGEGYDQKIPKKTPDVLLSSIYRWCEFQQF